MRLPAPTDFEDHGVGINYDANKPLGGLPQPSKGAKATTVFWSVYTDAHTLQFGTHWFWARQNGSFEGANYFGVANRLTTGTWNFSISCAGTDFITADAIVLGRWYRQALRRREIDATNATYDYYYDLPDITKVLTTTQPDAGFTVGTSHQFRFFDNTWSSGSEQLDGRLDRVKVYEFAMPTADILEESKYPWPHIGRYEKYLYCCIPNMALSDLRDVSGKGHNFSVLTNSPAKFVDSEPPAMVPKYVPQWKLRDHAFVASAGGSVFAPYFYQFVSADGGMSTPSA